MIHESYTNPRERAHLYDAEKIYANIVSIDEIEPGWYALEEQNGEWRIVDNRGEYLECQHCEHTRCRHFWAVVVATEGYVGSPAFIPASWLRDLREASAD